MSDNKNRYSDAELEEFRIIIQAKIDMNRADLKRMKAQIENSADEHAEERSTGLDDGAGTLEKETINKIASRTVKFIQHLENAISRIENKTYGICRETGKLIKAERLKAVPHATLSIEAKEAQSK